MALRSYYSDLTPQFSEALIARFARPMPLGKPEGDEDILRRLVGLINDDFAPHPALSKKSAN